VLRDAAAFFAARRSRPAEGHAMGELVAELAACSSAEASSRLSAAGSMPLAEAPKTPLACFTIDVNRNSLLFWPVILSFRDKHTQAFADGAFVKEFQGFVRQAWKRLEILDAATSLDDLRALPSNRLEALRGDRRGQYSIRINAQWRICFAWPRGAAGPSNVEIVDCH
jgi:proteic killer suppression protein